MSAPLHSLLEKYRELRRLRLGEDEGQPVQRMREVAARWPGALREIDELPMELIQRRIEALEAARDGGPVPAWSAPLSHFHGLMRACLTVKRHAGRDVEAAAAWIEGHYHPGEGDPSKGDLRALAPLIARPPKGRLSRMVLQEVATRASLSLEHCERLLFPPSPRRTSSSSHG